MPVSEPPKVEVQTPPAAPSAASVPVVAEKVFKLRRGKMLGGQPAAKLLGQFKNEKTPGVTTEKCWNYGKFAVVEMKSTDEIGSAELTLRLPGSAPKALCAKEYEGPKKDLRLIEGHFAGVMGDFILVDGEDATEGVLEFQVFNLDGKEVLRSHRQPDQDLVATVNGGTAALTYFAKIQVRCELAADGEECWKKVVAANRLPKTSMPDCKTVFEKSKTPLTEPALVTVKAHVANVSNPKVKFLGGQATCTPAP